MADEYDPGKIHWPFGDPREADEAGSPSASEATLKDGAETSVAKRELEQFIARVEFIDEQIAELNGDKKDIFAEAKGAGFDVKAMKRVLQLRRMDTDERRQLRAVISLYLQSLGMD